MFILGALYGVPIKLDRYIVLNIMTEIISKVSEVIFDMENVRIRSCLLDRIIEKIHWERERNEFVQETKTLRVQVKEADKFLSF